MIGLLPTGRFGRRLVTLAMLGIVVCLGVWIAIHRVPGFGPWLADGARSVAGPRAVAWVEDVAYGAEDWVNRKTREDEPPQPLWQVPSASGAAASSARAKPSRWDFQPKDVGPVHRQLAAPGDGTWVGMVDPRHPGEPSRMVKTLLHPDRNRSWATVAVVAIDLRQAELHLVAGRHEPEARTPEGKAYERRGLVEPGHLNALLAAFNGGYKGEHGHYGMKVGGVALVPARSLSCAVARYDDGRVTVASWDKLVADEGSLAWWRQTPTCMVEQGEPSPVLSMKGYGWGASSVSGTTVIRRSAIGIDRGGKTLFVGIGDFTTASAIAEAMRHAGATTVAQLDVNFSFPKFVTFQPREPGSTELVAMPLTEHFELSEDDYVRKPAARDFFYLTRREIPGS